MTLGIAQGMAQSAAGIGAPRREPAFGPAFGDDGLSFGDLLDVVNPLQHLPIIGTLYRAITGDDIAPAARLAGGALFGGVVGFGASLANLAFEGITGRDVGDTLLAWTGLAGDGETRTAAIAEPEAPKPTPAQGAAPGLAALLAALESHRIGADTAARAALAYRAGLALPQRTDAEEGPLPPR